MPTDAVKTVTETQFPSYPVRRGKVRDVYDLGDEMLLVATDRISAYDVILPTPIPQKGVMLTSISKFWFEYFSDNVPHHLISVVEDHAPAAGETATAPAPMPGYEAPGVDGAWATILAGLAGVAVAFALTFGLGWLTSARAGTPADEGTGGEASTPR